jgi:hypothetical protein
MKPYRALKRLPHTLLCNGQQVSIPSFDPGAVPISFASARRRPCVPAQAENPCVGDEPRR